MNDLVNDQSQDGATDLDGTLTALAEPARRQVVELLRRGPRRASDIADAIGMSRQATSRHLNLLRSRGIVDVDLVDADGRGRAYRLRPERLAALQAWLDQVQAGHAEQLAAFKRHAERGRGPQA
ncbi:MAG TPA: metalloregulator ArsR/SmtB family transcription factor [Acidimicrobiales bacterium]